MNRLGLRSGEKGASRMPVGRMMILVLIFMFLGLGNIQAKNDLDFQQESENWLVLAEQIVVYVEKGKYLEAREQLHQLSQQFARSDLSKKHLKLEVIHILSHELIQMEQKLNQVVISNPEEVKRNAIRLKLAFDAVSHQHQPLWKQYYQSFQKQVTRFKQAYDKKEAHKMDQSIQMIVSEYRLIRSALIISKNKEAITKLDSLIRFMEKQKDPRLQKEGIQRWEEIIHPLFFGSDRDVVAAYRPYIGSGIIWVISWLVFWITMVFVYVGWRKYQLRQA